MTHPWPDPLTAKVIVVLLVIIVIVGVHAVRADFAMPSPLSDTPWAGH